MYIITKKFVNLRLSYSYFNWIDKISKDFNINICDIFKHIINYSIFKKNEVSDFINQNFYLILDNKRDIEYFVSTYVTFNKYDIICDLSKSSNLNLNQQKILELFMSFCMKNQEDFFKTLN